MPTNKELIEDILKIQPDVDTEGLDKVQLTALLSDLQAAHALSAPGDTEEEKNQGIYIPPQPEPTAAQLYAASRQPEISKMADGAMNILNTLTGVQQGGPDLELEDDTNTDPEVATQRKVHTVANNKAITTRRGLMGPGREIGADDLTGGQESLDFLISKGYVE